MARVLGKAGVSLADVYDVEGSVSGVADLRSEEVQTVHEMGATIFSERLNAAITIITTGAIAQNIDFGVGLAQPLTVRRIVALVVIASTAGRTARAQVSITGGEAGSQTECPLFSWESGTGTDLERELRIEVDGVAAAHHQLVPGPSSIVSVPSFVVGSQGPIVDQSRVIMRGRTGAFGAGTVVVRCVLYQAFSEVEGISSFGLPVPSW